MGNCRNCGSDATRSLGFVGDFAPFFLKRVLNLEYGDPPTERRLKRFLRRIPVARSIAQKIYETAVLAEMEVCQNCTFVQTKIPFSDESLARLYVDYRSDSYNQERIRYEPSYAAIASHVGRSDQEIRVRKVGLTQWLTPKIHVDPNFSMLDFGGADGRFLPTFPGSRYVFEISDIDPAPEIKKLTRESELSTYSYVQLAHVLEHVSHPLQLTRKAASFLNGSGVLYIEVPQEFADEKLTQLVAGHALRIPIHEHINQYSVRSITELLKSVGLAVVAVESAPVDLGWTRATVIRALGQKS